MADAPDRARATAASAEPLVLDDLRTADDKRALQQALRQTGHLRALYRTAGAQAALSQFDDQLSPVLDRLPGALPHDVRRRLGLPTSSS
ncbi:hypothetical protein [Salinibacter altiplanensis]|uniref:hypothetical protein n=1 Tax=Salinibacter altiplanensis TaxID=1803181 RepID=UPI000C9F4007|nr:hypothetical protein [Salinibacter altiplanensis]